MIFRLTQILAKKIKQAPLSSSPPALNPYADWSAHLFTANRLKYIIVSNTASLYSIIIPARGITDSSSFTKSFMDLMADFMRQDNCEFLFQRLIATQMNEVIFSKSTDRRVIGSINDLVYMAKCHLIESQLSLFETSQRVNRVPMSYIGYDRPREALYKMKPAISTSDNQ